MHRRICEIIGLNVMARSGPTRERQCFASYYAEMLKNPLRLGCLVCNAIASPDNPGLHESQAFKKIAPSS